MKTSQFCNKKHINFRFRFLIATLFSYMVKAGIARTRILILRSAHACIEAKRIRSSFGGFQATRYNHTHNYHHPQQDDDHDESRNELIHEGKMDSSSLSSSCWGPDPRTGIYVPKGHERIMDGVPENAASFHQTFWLRNVDGVDRPDPDVHSF
ncbi:uncharacterized protein LOC126661284 [Mercurialis annua]|uniref:uncharacterized protein LOC126661284 n=1 Tax=Mercurialis annua TaxID=3986 RepID=UPI002160394C|nr:uncharacterized protein LOC126661284 [Mercurialis annua]